MNKKCSNCGTPAPDGASVFCNRCGARLPANAPVLICPQCNKTFTDPQSCFCNRCGSPLAPAAAEISPAIRAAIPPSGKGTRCSECGFENPGGNVFFCKKCGASLPKTVPVSHPEPAGNVQSPPFSGGGIRIVPDGMDELRQRPVYVPAEQPAMPLRTVPQKNVPSLQGLPREQRQEVPQTSVAGYNRRVAYGAAGVLVLVLIIAGIAMIVPGMISAGTTGSDSSSPGLSGVLSGMVTNQTTAEATVIPTSTKATTVTTPKATPSPKKASSVLNQGNPVLTDTPLSVNKT